MKFGKKALLFLSAAVMVMQLATGCGGNGEGNNSKAEGSAPGNTSGGGATSFKMPEQKMNFEGRTITIASIWNNSFKFGDNIEQGESASGDLWLEWRRTVEDTYNCKIKIEMLNSNDTQVSLINKFMAGEKVADIINGQMVDVERIRLAGDFLTDLNTVSTLNLQCEGNLTYGKNIMDACTWNGKTYAMFPAGGNIQNALVVNMDLLESLNLGYDLWEMVENKTWNFDAFRNVLEAAKRDLNGDGQFTSKDQFGTYVDIGMVQCMAMNGGVRALKKNEDGTCEYTLNTPNTVTTVNEIKDLLVDSGLCPEIRLDEMYRKLFKQGQILMMPCMPWIVNDEDYEDLDFSMGLLPVPIGGSGTEYGTIGDAWMETYFIPKLNTEPEYAGLILQSMAEDFYLKAMEVDFEDYANSVFVGHEPSMDVYKMLQSNIVYTLAYPETGWQDAYYCVLNGVVDSTNPITTLLEAVDTPLKAYLNDTYNKAVR